MSSKIVTQRQTFKEYLTSKDQLLEAIQGAPIVVLRYTPNRYLDLVLAAQNGSKHLFKIKPSYDIEVYWEYDNDNNAEVTRVVLYDKFDEVVGEGVPEMNSLKFQTWLARHATNYFFSRTSL